MSEIMNEQAVPIPEPVKKEMEEEINITADTITEEIIGVGDDGYSRSDIIMLIEKIHNVLKNPENITEDDHEYVKQIDVEYCKVDIFSINDSTINLILKFDTPEDAFLRELIDALDYYRNLIERTNEESYKNDNVPIPVLTFTFAPYKFKGLGLATFGSPLTYFRTLDENNNNCCLHLLFEDENVQFEKVEISDDDLARLRADAMREEEAKESTVYNNNAF